MKYITLLFLLISCNANVKPEDKSEASPQQSTIIIDSGKGNSVSVTQSGKDSSIVIINGEKWVNGKKVKK